MNKKPKKKKKQKINKGALKSNKKTGKKVFKVIIIFVVLGFLAYASYYLLTEPKFNISKIQLEGSKKYKSEDVIKATNIKTGTNIFKVLKSDAVNNLSEYSYISDIKLTRKLPSTLIIKIIEYEPKYLAYNKDTSEYVKLDKEGIILEILNKSNSIQSEKLTFGINFSKNIILKEKIALSEIAKLKLYEEIDTAFIETKINKKITSIKFENSKVTIVLDYNLSVVLEEKDLHYDMSNLNAILNDLEGKSGVLDMTKPSPIYTENIK